MRMRTLGSSDLTVPVVGLGCNNFGGRLDLDRTRAVVDAALDAGVTFFDTADIYGGRGGSERLLGEVLAGRRDEVVLATKFGHQSYDMGYPESLGPKGGRTYLRYAVEQSLTRLRTDVIDLYQVHTPDPVTPVEETTAALDELVAEGRVRFYGHSNYDAALMERAGPSYVSAQNHWSLLERDEEASAIPAARRLGLGVLPYFPLANGLLTGKVRRGGEVPAGSRLAGRDSYVTEDKLDRVEALAAFADARG
ncbi:MAG: aldo/keto reductase, partial [Pseudonocardia sp.]|nr:aldo/keto reductase [Pseudonocardia sp.]